MSERSHERFPGPTFRGTARQIMSDPGGAHLMSWHRTNASGAYSVWMAQAVTRYSGHFPLCNVCPVCGTPFPRPKTRQSRVYLGTYQVLATQGHPQRSERAVQSDASRRSSSVSKRVDRPQNLAPNRHPARLGTTIRIEAASTRIHIKVEGFGATELSTLSQRVTPD